MLLYGHESWSTLGAGRYALGGKMNYVLAELYASR